MENLGGWETRLSEYGYKHIVPMNDLREHLPHECWCRPTPEAGDTSIIVHHAMDQRELYETGTLKRS